MDVDARLGNAAALQQITYCFLDDDPAAVVGLAAPAQADIAHHEWVHDNQQRATTGQVTSTFGNGR